jgi:hypothetical protein
MIDDRIQVDDRVIAVTVPGIVKRIHLNGDVDVLMLWDNGATSIRTHRIETLRKA